MIRSEVVATVSRRCDCLIALCAGMVFLPAVAFGYKALFRPGTISLTLLVMIVTVSAIAGAVAAGCLPLKALPRELGLPLAGKSGGRTGLLTAFLASGMIVLGLNSAGAMAQLAVLWAMEPAAAVTHAASQDPALESATPGDDCAHFSPAPVHPSVAIELVPADANRGVTARPLHSACGASLQQRILAASRLLANPPPFGV